ncbi:MAG: A/G-specific adenine glycosylase [Planctomycetota bacterium]
MSRRRSPSQAKSTFQAAVAEPNHDPAWNDSRWRSRLRRRLLDWYEEHARTMPWRSDPTPYHVWVSEIMCQQTQVATVIPYFQRFVAAYPDVATLAAADEQQLMRLWEGLGYYRRARSLHAAAKQIVDRHDGVFPDNFDDVLALPGIGRYTAGAILSISGDARLPILEGNTQRVFSRWLNLQSPPTEKLANALLWQFAETMLPPRGSGTFNQAAMELGALVCAPKKPRCDDCPVRSYCASHRENTQDQVPGKVTKTQYVERTEFAFVIQDHHQHLLLRRLPEGGRWAGLWDFPRTAEIDVESVNSAGAWLSESLGRNVDILPRVTTFKHAVTKYRITLHVHHAILRGRNQALPKDWQFFGDDQLDALPLNVTGRKIADHLQSDRQSLFALDI